MKTYYPLCNRFINDKLNSWDQFYLWIDIDLKKDWFNRNTFIISYTPKNLDFDWINRIIEKDYSIENIIHKYGFNENDRNNINWITIKKAIQNVLDYRKWKIKYL